MGRGKWWLYDLTPGESIEKRELRKRERGGGGGETNQARLELLFWLILFILL